MDPTLQGIGNAFFASDTPVEKMLLVLVLAVAAALVIWLTRSELRAERARIAIERKHWAGLAASHTQEHTEWFRVLVNVPLIIRRIDTEHHRIHEESFETHDVSGGGLSYLTHAPPGAGANLEFLLDLHEKRRLELRGTVVHVDPPKADGAASLVSLRLGPITPAAQEHLVHWLTQEELRQVARAKQGRLCTVCGRPLADDKSEMHSTCALRRSASPAKP